MDPRIRGRNPDYGKRPASRSPEGSTSRKLSKASHREGSSTPNARDGTSSRRSSVSTTAAQSRPMQPPNGAGIKPFSVRPPAQKEQGPTYVASPDSLGSRRGRPDEVPSGESTPRSANGTVKARQDSTLGALTVNSAPLKPGPNHFMKCMAHNTEVSKLSNAHDQAGARVKRAEAEYQNMSKHFRDFPVIKEQKTQALADAKTALETTRQAFEKQNSVQRQLAEEMGRFLESTEVKPVRDSPSETITITIEDFRQLCTRVSKIEADPRGTAAPSNDTLIRDRITTLEAEANDGPSPKEMKSLWSELDSLRSKLEHNQDQTHKLWSAIDGIYADNQARQVTLQAVRAKADKAASESGQVPGFFRDIDYLKRTTERLDNDIKSTKRPLEDSSRAPPREDTYTKQLPEQLPHDTKSTLSQLKVVKADYETLKTRIGLVDEQSIPADSICGKVIANTDQITALSARLQRIEDEVRDEEKHQGPVIKRLSKLEQEAKRSATRLDEVGGENYSLQLQAAALRASSSAQPGSATAVMTAAVKPESAVQALTTMLDPIGTRLDKLEADSAHREQTREQDEDLIINHVFEANDAHLAEQKKWVEDELATIREQSAKDREIDSKRITQSLTELATSTSDTLKAIKSNAEDMKKNYAALTGQIGEVATRMEDDTVSKRSFIAMQDTVNKRLEEFLKALETLQASTANTNTNQRSRLPNGTPGAATNGFQPPSIRSPQVNGIQKNNAAAAATAADAPTNQRLTDLSNKLEALTYAFQMFQRQYNNVITDDLAAKMLEQFGDVWPHAKNYNQAIADVNHLVAQTVAAVGRAESSAGKALEGAKGLEKVREEVKGLGGLQEEVKGLRGEMGRLKGRVARQEGEVEAVKEFLESNKL